MMRISFHTVMLIATLFFVHKGFAKGLETLQPSVEEPKKDGEEKSPEDAAKGETPAPSADGQAVPATGAVAASPTPAPAVVAEKKIEPSETSKFLANKLSVTPGIGFFRILSAKEGDWHSNGIADLAIAWKFRGEAGQKMSLYGTFRYTPIEVDNVIDGQSYRGIIEGYHLGAVGGYKLSEKFNMLASVELGYLLVYLDSVDNFEIQEDSETNKIAFTLGLGGDWIAMEKIKFGPRLYYGLGDFRTMQLSLAGTFVF